MRAAGSSAAAPTCMCAAFSGGAAAPGHVSALDGVLAVARHAPWSWRRSARTRCSHGISSGRRPEAARGTGRERRRRRCCRQQLNALSVAAVSPAFCVLSIVFFPSRFPSLAPSVLGVWPINLQQEAPLFAPAPADVALKSAHQAARRAQRVGSSLFSKLSGASAGGAAGGAAGAGWRSTQRACGASPR